MYKDIKHPIRLLLLTLLLCLLAATPAAAAIDAYIAEGAGGELYQYSYVDLLDSYALKILGFSNGLYEDFAAKKPHALLSSSGKYIDYKDVLDRYASSIILNEKFDLTVYLSGSEAKSALMPDSLKLVKLSSGSVEFTVKKLTSATIESDSSDRSSETMTLIAGPPQVSLEEAQKWALDRSAHQRFVDIAPLYWKYGEKTGLRPEVLYAQAAVETDFGYYSNRVPPSYNNWAGIKIAEADGDAVENHEAFSSAENGVIAHYNHLAAYVGFEPLGEPHDRYFVVAGQPWAGTLKYVEELSGRWTPAGDYHGYILNLLDQIKKSESVDSPALPERRVSVNVGILHLRSGPGTNHEILERLHLGTTLQITGNQEEWLKVVAPGNKNGWVHGDYVRELDYSPSADNPLLGKIIAIDPGHGGSDPGAVGSSGTQEKVINLAVAFKLAALLEEAGATVVMTRYGDQSMSNQQRVDLANQSKADLYLSIHANAYANPLSNGTETHYYGQDSYSSASRYLAHQLQSELVFALNLRDRGVKTSSFFIIRQVNMPAALVEMAFLTNPEEEEILKSAAGQDKAARALYNGLKAYFLHFR